MKKILYFIISALLLIGCSKENSHPVVLSTTINVVNAAVNLSAIKAKINDSPSYYALATQVSYGAGALVYAPRATTSFTLVSTSDTTTNILNTSFNFTSSVYSLFIAGQSTAIDTVVIREANFPYIHYDPTAIDSSIYIRFVNLSPNSLPVSINIKNNTTPEVTNLAYKGYTVFKKYPALLPANSNYIFEVRDATSNALLYSFTYSITTTNRFKDVALIVKGLESTSTGTNAFGMFAANYF